MERFFGGHPASVALRLVIISIVVGVVLNALEYSPLEIIPRVRDLIHYLSKFAEEAISNLIGFLLLGAVIVIPVWLVVRIAKLASQFYGDR
jgi:hypothetical protein